MSCTTSYRSGACTTINSKVVWICNISRRKCNITSTTSTTIKYLTSNDSYTINHNTSTTVIISSRSRISLVKQCHFVVNLNLISTAICRSNKFSIHIESISTSCPYKCLMLPVMIKCRMCTIIENRETIYISIPSIIESIVTTHKYTICSTTTCV